MRPMLNVRFDGRINRRDLPNEIGENEVLIRENIEVVGNGKTKRLRKVPGASRFSDNNKGTSYVWGHRYYSRNIRKTFAFNNGLLYNIDDNGNETADTNPFAPTANPCSEVMRVSSNDVLYFSEGINTGMFSYDGNIGNVWQKEIGVTLNLAGMLGHLDRLFGFEEDSEDLLFSKNLEPANFTDSSDAGLITIGPRRGSKIMAIALLRETIYIFKQDSIWRLSGRSPYEFEVSEVVSFLGAGARDSVKVTDNGIIFLGSDFEFYFFGGTQDSLVMLSYKVAINGDYTKNLQPIINRYKVDSIRATYYNKQYRCSFVESGQTTNNLEYVFNTINETDHFTRGFNVSSYIKWDRYPDDPILLTGRTDLGRLMKINVGLNVDNDATAPHMRVRLQTRFVGAGEPRNFRTRTAYFNFGVLGAEPLRGYYYLDCRTARSAAGSDVWVIRGETKGITKTVSIASQAAITSRVNLKYGKAKGQNISFEIDTDGRDLDFELSSIDLEAIVQRTRKKSEKVNA